MKMDTDADYVLEAYWLDYKLVDNVVKRDKKHMLAYITVYKEYENTYEQLEEILALRDALIVAYRFHLDDNIIVQLTIKEEMVNA